jgi:hypothetical protein
MAAIAVVMDNSVQISVNMHNLYIVLVVLAIASVASLVFRKSRQ